MPITTSPLWRKCALAGLLVVVFCQQARTQTSAKTTSPELVGQLTKALSITPAQASGGAGALFSLAKSKLSPADFSKVASAVPGMESLLKSTPAASSASSATSGIPGLSSLGGLGGLASVAGKFQKLGLPPEMVAQFVPILTKYVESKGGSGVASLLAGAVK